MDMFEGVGRRLDQRTGSFLDIGQHSLNGRERNCLFRNDGDGTFTEVGWVNDADRVEDGRGLAIFDYDRDGRLDLVLRNYRQPAELLHNQGPPRHWIQVKLVGTRSNRDAIGARVVVVAGGQAQLREVAAGDGYASQSALRLHFGLGDEAEAELLAVTWPASGLEQRFRGVAADRIVEVTEGSDRLVEKRYRPAAVEVVGAGS